jgi:proteasome assembly chaperone (PAC2) family protein
MIMDEVAWHREPPSHIPTMVTALSGWIDAGEAATDAMRFLVRQLAAEPLAAIDLEDFVDFTQVRPVVRLTAEGERTIRWPRSAFWFWQPPAPRTGLLLFRGLEPQRRWRTYATALLDVAARCGVQQIVSLGAMLADLPHTRPPRVTGSSTDPHWHAQFEAWGMARRSRYEGPTGIASVMLDAARHRGIASMTVELFPNKESGRLYSKKLWREPTDGNPRERRASNDSLNRLVPNPMRRPGARLQRHLRGHTAETL